MHSSLAFRVLGALGVAGIVRRRTRVEADIHEHLTSTYGEPFVVTRVNGQSLTNARFPDKYNFEANPVADPDLPFRGTADYEARPARITDLYVREQLGRWLPRHVVDALGPRHRVGKAVVSCASVAGLPPHPSPGQPLPPNKVTLKITVESYVDGDPMHVAEATRDALRKAAERLNVHLRGRCESYPAALWDHVAGKPPGELSAHADEDWHTAVLAEAALGQPHDEPAVAYPRAVSVEAQVTSILDALCPDARRSIWARHRDLRGRDRRHQVDIRIAADGLSTATMEAVASRLGADLDTPFWTLRGIDTPDPQGPQRQGFVCRKRGCQAVSGPLIDPSVLGRSVTTDTQ